MGPAGFLCALSCRLAFFRRKNQHYRGHNAKSCKSIVFYRALCGPPPGQPESDDPYRGFAQVGRCGTGKARPGEKGDGKTRYFLTEGCAVPGREARSMFGTANTIGEVGCRMARSLQIYVRSGAPDFGIANTIEDLGHRIAPRPQSYVNSETSVLVSGRGLDHPNDPILITLRSSIVFRISELGGLKSGILEVCAHT